jgi:hypothetical protein
VSVPEPSDDLPRFFNGRVDPYGGRLLPVCCPDAQASPGPQSESPAPLSLVLQPEG